MAWPPAGDHTRAGRPVVALHPRRPRGLEPALPAGATAMTDAIGVDFGTTNTVVAQLDADGGARLVEVAGSPTFRSALSFARPPADPKGRIIEAGPFAIEAYVEDPLETRFIQSFKSYAASPLFTETRILERRYVFEDLLSTFLLSLRGHNGDALAALPPRVIVGRPVA